MNKVLIVIKETYRRQIRSISFWFMVIAPFFFIGLSLGIGWVTSQVQETSDADKVVALVSQDQALKQQVQVLGGFTNRYQSENSARKALKDEKIFGYILVDEVDGQLKAVYHSQKSMDMTQEANFIAFLQNYQNQMNLSKAELTSDQQAILARMPSFEQKIAKSQQGIKEFAQFVAFYGLVMFMYIILITYTTSTAQEIASEKGTKIMEVIFSSIPAHRYFFGRILGIFAIIMTHIGIYIVGGVIGYQVLTRLDVIDLSPANQELIDSVLGNMSISTILFVIFGILIFVIFSALCGSLVTRVEDANKAVSPVMTLIMVAFFGVFILGQTGDHILLRIGSYIPFLSTFFMPVRSINGNAGAFEVWLSLGILLVTTLALTFYVGKSYAGLVLQTDDLGLWKSFKKGMTSR